MDKGGISARKSAVVLITGIPDEHAGNAAAAWSRTRVWEGHPFMLHVTCDLCGKAICPGQDQRYVVKIEIFPAHDPGKITEADLDEDHMEAVSELIREMDENGEEVDLAEPICKHFRYDLCPDCHKRYLRDPLSKELSSKFDFSEN
jgi:hypothetical protein